MGNRVLVKEIKNKSSKYYKEIKNKNFCNNQNYILGELHKNITISNKNGAIGIFGFFLLIAVFNSIIDYFINGGFTFFITFLYSILGVFLSFGLLPKIFKDGILKLSNRIFLLNNYYIFLLKPGKALTNTIILKKNLKL